MARKSIRATAVSILAATAAGLACPAARFGQEADRQHVLSLRPGCTGSAESTTDPEPERQRKSESQEQAGFSQSELQKPTGLAQREGQG